MGLRSVIRYHVLGDRQAIPAQPAAITYLGPACGHTRHVGTCPVCQRAQLDRWSQQLHHVRAVARLAPPTA